MDSSAIEQTAVYLIQSRRKVWKLGGKYSFIVHNLPPACNMYLGLSELPKQGGGLPPIPPALVSIEHFSKLQSWKLRME